MTRLVFLGTPDAAVEPLRTLVGSGHDVALVVSRPDKRRGRGGALVPSPVKAAALELGLAVTDSLADVTGTGAELGVVVAYGRIIPVSVLHEVPMVNLHFSLLPRWRGAAPVERAILEDDAETGVCLMAVEAGLDTGGIYAVATTTIGTEETADELRPRLVTLGCGLLEEHLGQGLAGLPRAAGPGRYALLRREDPARRARTALGPARRPAAPGGPVGPGLDDVPAPPSRDPDGRRRCPEDGRHREEGRPAASAAST